MSKTKKALNLTGLISLALMGVLLIMQFLPYWSLNDSKISMWQYVAFPNSYKELTEYFEGEYRDYRRAEFDTSLKTAYEKQLRSLFDAKVNSGDETIKEYLTNYYYETRMSVYEDDWFKAYQQSRFEAEADKDLAKAAKVFSPSEMTEIYKSCYALYPSEYTDAYFNVDYAQNEKGYLIDSIIIVPWGLLLCLIFGIICKIMYLDFGVYSLTAICGIIGVSRYVTAYRNIGALTMSNLWWAHLAVFAIIMVLGLWSTVTFLSSRYNVRITRK